MNKISPYFVISDTWKIEFQKWFKQIDIFDISALHNLANSELISEKNNKSKDNFHRCCEDFWGLRVDKKFPSIFYEKTREVIGLENLGSLSFALKVLEIFAKDVTALEQEIIDWLKGEIEKNISGFRLHDSFGEVRPIFRNFIETYELCEDKLPQLKDAIFKIYINQAWNDKDTLSVNKATKDEWEKFLFHEISQDLRFESFNSSYIVQKVLERENGSDLGKQICNVITEIYHEKAEEDEFYKNYMSFLIARLHN